MMKFICKQNDGHSIFINLALTLLNHHIILTGKKRFRLTEIEFYLFDKTHKDNHAHEHDSKAGIWRAHYAGLDITIQSDDPESYGGILLRGIQDLDTNEFISGPLKVMNTIFGSLGNVRENNPFKLEEFDQLEEKPIYAGPRIGLERMKDRNKDFLNKNYRFVLDAKNSKHSCPAKEKLIKEGIKII